MKILMTNNALDQRAGSESYLETVAVALRRLGHEVSLFSPTCGAMAARLRQSGFDVYESVADLPRDVDVIHGQHANAVGLARTRFPRTPLVFATHSWFITALEDPVAELGAAAYVVFNEFTSRRLAAHAATAGVEILRLTQPVEISVADGAREPIRPSARLAVAVSRRMILLPGRLATACAAHGIDFDWIGAPDRDSPDARQEMLAADIVVGMGRTALEAMAAGKAVLVADEATTGGWVTAASYPGLEADGFTGLGVDHQGEDLEAMLGGYTQQHGSVARHLVVQHHAAHHHAVRLVEIYAGVADTGAEARSPQTITLLANDRFMFEQRAVQAEWSEVRRRREADGLRAERDQVRHDLERTCQERDQVRHDLERTRQELDQSHREITDVRAVMDRFAAEIDALGRSRAEIRDQRDAHRKERNRLRVQRRELRRQLDETAQSLARIERRGLVRLSRLLGRLRRPRSARLGHVSRLQPSERDFSG